MRVGEMRVGEMRVGEMRVGEMRVGKMRVGEMALPPSEYGFDILFIYLPKAFESIHLSTCLIQGSIYFCLYFMT